MNFDDISENNIELYCMKYYDNPQCIGTEDYRDDMKRFKYLKRLLNHYLTTHELKQRLILNHLIMIYNLFDNEAATRILFYKIDENSWQVLKPFLIYLKRMPKIVRSIRSKDIRETDIILDQNVVKQLRSL
ncbi:MAG: hypothetical protein CL432_09520 [Acidimicrobiaceae bacterium]|nr:hypothetical protein [Acidimicrobiaceae bacterium]